MPAMFKTGVAALALAAFAALPNPAFSADAAATPTFAKDVAPIFQAKCQVCHRPGSMGPMSLLTYQDARPWARAIRTQVETKMMPPWHISRTVGIQSFKNDRSLTEEQADTIIRWVDAGAPMGDPKDLPPAKVWDDGVKWQLAERFNQTGPDLILKTDPYTMAAVGEDKWWRSLVDIPVTEERWVRAVEVRPSVKGRKVTHHVTSNLRQEEKGGLIGLASSVDPDAQQDGQFMEWAIGKTGEIFAEDAGKLLLPGSKLQINVHYYSNGEVVPNDQVEMGVYLYPKGERPKYRTILHSFGAQSDNGKLDIPPGEVKMTQNFHVLKAPARLENFQPHMHMRGKAMEMEAVYPDGKREVLGYVDNYQWNWHTNYIFNADVAPLLPKGTTIVITAWHDNTATKNNPDPRQWVGYGDRTVDEMAHAWVDVTYLTQEDYEKYLAARKANQTKNTQNQQ